MPSQSFFIHHAKLGESMQQHPRENEQVRKEDGLRWIWIIGLCAGLGALNLDLLKEWVPSGLSAAITIVLATIACYGCGMLYRHARASHLANLAEHHARLAGQLKALQDRLQAMERQSAKDRLRQAEAAANMEQALARHAALLANQIDQGRQQAMQAEQAIASSVEAAHQKIAASIEVQTERTGKQIDGSRNEIMSRLDGNHGAALSQLDRNSRELTSAMQERYNELAGAVEAGHAGTIASIEAMRTASAAVSGALEQRITETMSALQQEALDKIVQAAAMRDTELHSSLEQRNRTVDDKFGHLNKQISSLSSTVGDRMNDLRIEVARTLAVATDVAESDRNHHEQVVRLIAQVMELDEQWAEGSKHVLARHEETAARIGNLEMQLSALHALVSMLRSVTVDDSRQHDKDRVETIHDDINGLLLINTYRDDVMRESEMHRHGNKIYMAIYDETGAMISSHNYDPSGELVSELLYYPNGAVKERRETATENGKKVMKTTTFTEQGTRK